MKDQAPARATSARFIRRPVHPSRWRQSGSNPPHLRKKTQRASASRRRGVPLGRRRLAAATHFRFALAAFAAPCVVVDIGEPSREFFVCCGSVVFGATAPLGV
jgi:hypothetical protein